MKQYNLCFLGFGNVGRALARLLVAKSAELLDILLEPIADSEGKSPKAKAIIVREYKADNIGLSHVVALSQKLVEASTQRPT